MPSIADIHQIANGCAKDQTRPADLQVTRAEWGTLAPQHRVWTGNGAATGHRSDPLLVDLARGTHLEPGAKILFLNTSDPKATWPADGQMQAAIDAGKVGVWEVPMGDHGDQQSLVFSDKLATSLTLEIGCSFEMKQMDLAGNVSANPAKIDLVNQGDGIDNFQLAAGQQLGDVTLSAPAYNRANDANRNLGTSSDYRFNRYADKTPPKLHPADVSLSYDVGSKTVTLAGERAVEKGSTFFLKKLAAQQTFEIKADENGTFNGAGIDLQPGDAFGLWIKDRNGVMLNLGQDVYKPAGDCAKTPDQNQAAQG